MFRFNSFNSFLASICISLFYIGLNCSSAFSATHLIDENGQLYGANGVLVGVNSYDVLFVDDTAKNLFCSTGEWDFGVVDSKGTATALSNALLDQVLLDIVIDTKDYLFDSNPTLTNGITYSHNGKICTPAELYNSNSNSIMISIHAGNAAADELYYYDTVGNTYVSSDADSSSRPSFVYAVWSLSPVPLPGTILLFGPALTVLAGLKRKKYFNKA